MGVGSNRLNIAAYVDGNVEEDFTSNNTIIYYDLKMTKMTSM